MLDRMIVVTTPRSHDDGPSNVALTMCVPIRGQKSRAKCCRIFMNSDFIMHWISDDRTMTREYADIPDLIRQEKIFATQFYGAHHEGFKLLNSPSRESSWPEVESHNAFHPLVNKKLCPMCNLLTYTKEPSVFCCLCNLWVHHPYDDSPHMKYSKHIDIKAIKDNNNIDYYCPVCVDMLMPYHKSTKEEFTIDTLLNCLQSFNLEGVEVKDEEEIEILNIVLNETLGD